VKNVIKIIYWFRGLITSNDSITILDTKGDILSTDNKLKYVPREGELLYLHDETIFYKVVKVVYKITRPRVVWVYVEIAE